MFIIKNTLTEDMEPLYNNGVTVGMPMQWREGAAMNEMMKKEKALDNLKKESEIVCQASGIFIFFGGACLFALTAVLAVGIAMQGTITRAVQDPDSSLKVYKILRVLAEYFTDGHPIGAGGQFNIGLFAALVLTCIGKVAVFMYVCFCIWKVFQNMRTGVSPFTVQNTMYWKRISQVFAVITVLTFLGAFVLKGLIVAMIKPLFFYGLFQSLNLLFEYGSYLQTESDETL